MDIGTMIVLGLGLSLDAAAAVVSKSVGVRHFSNKDAWKMALCFASFQALMPWIGWMIGIRFERYIVMFDHWLAFLLLLVIGGKLLLEQSEDESEIASDLESKDLLLLGIATSLDALAVGIGLACLAVNLVLAISFIWLITFFMCLGAAYLRFLIGSYCKRYANLTGGTILILIGVKILIEHLFF